MPGKTFVVQSLRCIWLFVTPWMAECQASLSLTISCRLLKLVSIELVMPSNQLILCCTLCFLPSIFPRIKVFFLTSQLFVSGGQKIGTWALASVLPVNIQDWFPLVLTHLNPLQSKGLSGVFCNTTVQKFRFFGAQTSLCSDSHIHTWLLEKPKLWLDGLFFFWGAKSLLFNILSRFVKTFLPKYKCLNFVTVVTICSDFRA